MSHTTQSTRYLLTAFAVVAWVSGGTALGQATISKCQDADGKWHYGDHAADSCESAITEIDYKGIKVREVAPPPTDEELKLRAEEQARKERESEQAAYQQGLDERLLATYENEQSILRARDERVQAIERSIEANKSLRQGLLEELETIKENAKNQVKRENLNRHISEYDAAIQALMNERSNTVGEYNNLLERYRRLTQ